MTICNSVLDMIGNTPMLKLSKFDTGPCELFLKLECQNPGGSIKDRIAVVMIDAAEKEGKIKPGGTIIEATAGNTGLGLGLVAAQKGYQLILVIPDKMSPDKIRHIRAMGVDVRLTRSDVHKGHPEHYQDYALRLSKEIPNSFFIDQFSNPNNPRTHETETGPEILQQMEGRIDAMVVGVGSSGTVTGLGRFFKENAPQCEMVVADPEGSILAELIETGVMTEAGSWLVEGIGEDFVPPICELDQVHKAYSISDGEAFQTQRELLEREGIMAGSSTGTLLAAALRYCREQSSAKRVVTLAADTGNKYLSKSFNDSWLADQGLLGRESVGDLRDIIARPADTGDIVTVTSEDNLITTYKRMRMFDVSQVPVMDHGKVVGLIDESDILLGIYNNEKSFDQQVSSIMVTDLKIVPPSATIDSILHLFKEDKIAIVADNDTFYGLITRIDLINHLRKATM
ncbi:MAG: pyridoxal-phosphate dependent enzyme [Gammaproteobacteria bacterium]|nr:pyridoxal-phosphate dependent enzyme [Gammaproteobacteria bacterium]MCZ6487359.1 pyridoxal-phosphate dependent enzyme [Gammaproteobacteria bacterium]MCZ6668124.1 pyridoxal-phosphate dependent enzyme [Gammaproteobacteria bacterium]